MVTLVGISHQGDLDLDFIIDERAQENYTGKLTEEQT